MFGYKHRSALCREHPLEPEDATEFHVAMRYTLLIAVLLGGCGQSASPELACQQRIVAVRTQSAPNTDPFHGAAYKALDRKGCTQAQLAVIERLAVLAAALPMLNQRNEQAAPVGAVAHEEAFQRLNDALIEYDTLEQQAKADLERLDV